MLLLLFVLYYFLNINNDIKFSLNNEWVIFYFRVNTAKIEVIVIWERKLYFRMLIFQKNSFLLFIFKWKKVNLIFSVFQRQLAHMYSFKRAYISHKCVHTNSLWLIEISSFYVWIFFSRLINKKIAIIKKWLNIVIESTPNCQCRIRRVCKSWPVLCKSLSNKCKINSNPCQIKSSIEISFFILKYKFYFYFLLS